MKKLFIALALLLGLGSLALAQVPAPAQQTPSRLDACNVFGTATGAGNATNTVTIPAAGGLSFYVCFFQVQVGANAAVTGAAVTQGCTTTGLPTNFTIEPDNGTLTNGQVRDFFYVFPSPQKTNPGNAFVWSCGSGQQSTQTFRLNVAGYYAP